MKLEHTAGGRARRRSRAAGICTFAISALPGGIAGELYLFYRYHRAALQARLAIALREPNPAHRRNGRLWPEATFGLQWRTPCAAIAFSEREEADEGVSVVETTDDLGEQSGQ